ncbi:hypothetical protein KSP40_PGU005537 [Platanthera guangdongensis]|uniref:Uncharacterized protein n=1 Tax=Platanthera guangdongensis TaxID=2320717 RepID=A0ABR2M4R8_9ASPA
MAMQTESDFVYIVDDDMIPRKKMLEILAHVGSTEKYKNSVLGSIGRIPPFRQKDFTFPSYRKLRTKEAGLYLPDPAYGITIDRIVQVDFLLSSWFLSSDLVKTLFVETPFTFITGEDLHLRYNLTRLFAIKLYEKHGYNTIDLNIYTYIIDHFTSYMFVDKHAYCA